MSLPKISIITPSFNQGRFIEETILSVLDQNYPNIEYIIMDGGSNDNTVEVIKKYESRLAYWVSEKDNGQTHAINKGFERATGDIITWINSDDVYCEGSLQAIADYFNRNQDCQWLAGNLLFMNESGQTYIRKYPNSAPWLERNAMMSIYQPNVFLRRSILHTIGYPREEFHMTMDYEWFCRIAQQYSIHIIDKDIAKFRWHSDSKSSSVPNSLNQQIYHREAISIIRKYHKRFAWFIDRFPKLTLFFWFRIEKVMRVLNRIFKGELYKLSDRLV
jgi:glycosyltransferase involved in cell wall biosynthesis